MILLFCNNLYSLNNPFRVEINDNVSRSYLSYLVLPRHNQDWFQASVVVVVSMHSSFYLSKMDSGVFDFSFNLTKKWYLN